MTSIEYGRHARRVMEWDEVDENAPVAEVDLSHGSVFHVEDEQRKEKDSLFGSVRRLLNRKVS